MQAHRAIPILLIAGLLASSCSDDDARESLTQPTAPFAGPGVSLTTTTATVIAVPVANAFCPSVAPFTVPIALVVKPIGTTSLFVTEIRLQFTDSSGIQMPQVTLPAPVMTTQFGTALVEARSARTFPLSLGIGCGTGAAGTVLIFVDTRDDDGRDRTGKVSVMVR